VRPAVPVASFYACFFAGLGLFHPLFPLFLTDHGVAPADAIRIMALFPLAGIISPPLVGLAADILRARAWLLRGATVLCALSVAALASASTLAALVALTMVYAFVRAPIWTLIDTAAYRTAEKTGGTYGRLRMFGSIGFLVAVVAGGALAEGPGWPAVLAATGLCYACAITAAFVLPAPPHEHRPRVLPAWIQLLARRDLWWFLGTIVVSQVAGAAYDSCYSLHLAHLGHGERFISLAWAIGVVAEIVVLMFSRRLLATFGAERLLVAAFLTSSVRWLLIAGATAPGAILAIQLLHGVTFPLYWVPAVILVQTLAPRELSTSAQGLLSAAAGVGSVIGMTLAGPIMRGPGSERLYVYAAAGAFAATVGAVLLSRARSNMLLQ
jgi:PPP family 3-phenylpropionic acid transporter